MNRTIKILGYMSLAVIFFGVAIFLIILPIIDKWSLNKFPLNIVTITGLTILGIIPSLAFGILSIIGATTASKECSGETFSRNKKPNMILRKRHDDKVAPFPYDPTWLVELAKKQFPKKTNIIISLKSCTTIVGFCSCGCGNFYFIDTASDEWNYDKYIKLKVENKHWWRKERIVLFLMKDKRIGAIEIAHDVL